MSEHYERIRQQYRNLRGDSTDLFNEILAVSNEIGMEAALADLEQCVIEKRSAWLQANLDEDRNKEDPVTEAYQWFYEKYLGACVPEDGEIVEHTRQRMVMRWWNACPTLEACRTLGLDTRKICRLAYHKPVQEFLARIHPRLRFERNYDRIRPYADYCEEIILLEE